MSALSIQPTYPIFTDIDGQPLEDGYVWIGTANLDPQTNPINVYWDAALTILAPQPIRTLAGYPSRNGTPARLYVNSDYSIRVMNKNGSVVYSAPAATERYSDAVISNINASQVIYDPAGLGAVATTVQAKLRETVSVKDFGAVGDGVTDDTAAIQAAIDYAESVHCQLNFPAGIYKTNSTLYIDSDSVIIYGEAAPSNGAGASRGLPNDVTYGAVIQYTGTVCALQVSKSRSVNPNLDGSNPGFIRNVQLRNLRIEVPESCAKALFVYQAAHGYFFNIAMWGSQSTGGVANGTALLFVSAGIDNIYEKISTNGVGRYTTAVPSYLYYVNFGMKLTLGYANDLATTTIFRRCYINYCNIGADLLYIYEFEDCVFESCFRGVQCNNDVTTRFSRCWWEANINLDVYFNNTRAVIENSRINSYARQTFFATGAGVRLLKIANTLFSTIHASPQIFSTSDVVTGSGGRVSIQDCVFPANTSIAGSGATSNRYPAVKIDNQDVTIYRFIQKAITAPHNALMDTEDAIAGKAYVMPASGNILGVNLWYSGSLGGGSFNIATKINGSNVADLSYPFIPIMTTEPQVRRCDSLTNPFNQGDELSFYLGISGFGGGDFVAEVIVAHGLSGRL